MPLENCEEDDIGKGYKTEISGCNLKESITRLEIVSIIQIR